MISKQSKLLCTKIKLKSTMCPYKELRNVLRYKFRKYLVKKWVNNKRKLTNPSEQTKEYEIIKRYTETNYFKTKLYFIGKKEKLRRYLKDDVTYKNF